ncbi:MAG: FHA domain-containing protein [Candidatus Bathyarchaeota archaeon]|nr:FHA domain-containing protein [Candidatus Bathyarchaeota archaeon]
MSTNNADGKISTTRAYNLEVEPAKIVIENGPDKGKEFLIDKPRLTIGRNPDNDICLLYDQKISRFHAQILFDKSEGAYYYEDLNSTNGTTISTKWFKNDRVKMKHGDIILIGGETRLRFFAKKLGLKDWLRG